MTLREAIDELWEISEGPVYRTPTLPRVGELLCLFTEANVTGDGYASEKIGDVRIWFEEMAKGGRGHYSFQQAQSIAQQSIAKLRNIVSPNDTSLRLPSSASPPLEICSVAVSFNGQPRRIAAALDIDLSPQSQAEMPSVIMGRLLPETVNDRVEIEFLNAEATTRTAIFNATQVEYDIDIEIDKNWRFTARRRNI